MMDSIKIVRRRQSQQHHKKPHKTIEVWWSEVLPPVRPTECVEPTVTILCESQYTNEAKLLRFYHWNWNAAILDAWLDLEYLEGWVAIVTYHFLQRATK